MSHFLSFLISAYFCNIQNTEFQQKITDFSAITGKGVYATIIMFTTIRTQYYYCALIYIRDDVNVHVCEDLAFLFYFMRMLFRAGYSGCTVPFQRVIFRH